MMSRRLILNFDINKTIIISDVGAGVSFENMLNSLISECVWGSIREGTERSTRTANDWILVSTSPSTSPPTHASSAGHLVTFGDFLESYTNTPKVERGKLKQHFTSPGGYGEIFKPYVDELKSTMELDAGTLAAASSQDMHYLLHGSYHIVPAFFNLVIELDKRGWDFRIIFRTFGVDTDRVAHEFNLFCSGLHPLYPDVKMNGEGESLDRRLVLPEYSGTIRRVSNDHTTGVLFASVNDKKLVQIASGYRGYQETIDDWIARGARTMAVQDDYNWWRIHKESDTSGKLHLVHESTAEEISIFFDDNIERDRAHIIDVRLRDSFDCLPFAESTRAGLIHRVEPYDVIRDPSYYIKSVDVIVVGI